MAFSKSERLLVRMRIVKGSRAGEEAHAVQITCGSSYDRSARMAAATSASPSTTVARITFCGSFFSTSAP